MATAPGPARGLAGGGLPGYRRHLHGLTDQEAPQAHAEEEAQEASQEDALAAPSAGPLALPLFPLLLFWRERPAIIAGVILQHIPHACRGTSLTRWLVRS